MIQMKSKFLNNNELKFIEIGHWGNQKWWTLLEEIIYRNQAILELELEEHELLASENNIVLNQQNQKSILSSAALKDAVSIKSFKDNQNFVKDRTKSPSSKIQQNWSNANSLSKQVLENNTSFEKMVNMESFRHYNKIIIKKEDSSRGDKENNSSFSNINNITVKENNNRISNSQDKHFAYTPSVQDRKVNKDLTTNTKFTTISKNSASNGPNMRIKRSSSKKNKTDQQQLLFLFLP